MQEDSDPTSVFWAGHLDSGAYIPQGVKLYQPHDVALGELGEGEAAVEVIQPSEVARIGKVLLDQGYVGGRDAGDDNRNGHSDGKMNGNSLGESVAKAGDHWFEVLPGNKVQREVVSILEA
jgi:hypothetical protein